MQLLLWLAMCVVDHLVDPEGFCVEAPISLIAAGYAARARSTKFDANARIGVQYRGGRTGRWSGNL